MNWLFPTLMFLSLAGVPVWGHASAPDCRADLISISGYRLGIGVLIETEEGGLHLGISPYAGSLHNAIVDKMLNSFLVRRIQWMGELRYRVDGESLQIREANETSGHYSQLLKTGLDHEGRDIPVQNSVALLPARVRTHDFSGIAYDPENMRLARELQDVKGDVRHTIGNSLQVILSQTMLLSMGRRSPEEKAAMLARFRTENLSDLLLMRWLILNLVEDGRIEFEEMDGMIKLIGLYSDPGSTMAEIQATDLGALDRQIQKLSRIVNPLEGQMSVDLYKIR